MHLGSSVLLPGEHTHTNPFRVLLEFCFVARTELGFNRRQKRLGTALEHWANERELLRAQADRLRFRI